MTTYNGHKNWNHWNVSLWINNDENLYRMANYCIRLASDRPGAVMFFQRELAKQGITHTPDGARYSASSIRAAMVGM
jgi:hypothetical protein